MRIFGESFSLYGIWNELVCLLMRDHPSYMAYGFSSGHIWGGLGLLYSFRFWPKENGKSILARLRVFKDQKTYCLPLFRSQAVGGYHSNLGVSGQDETGTVRYRCWCGWGSETVPGLHFRCCDVWKLSRYAVLLLVASKSDTSHVILKLFVVLLLVSQFRR